jgi:mRNA-degrading endonuclease RelE of RelBE toxin-antitoxin system
VNQWTVEVDPAAGRELRRLDEGPKRDALELMEDLAEDPYAVSAHELEGYQNTWSARFCFDQYRMIFQIAKPSKRVLVTRIRSRSTAYEGMKKPAT